MYFLYTTPNKKHCLSVYRYVPVWRVWFSGKQFSLW